MNVWKVHALSLPLSSPWLSLSDYHSSDSEGNFGTPEAATPVHGLSTILGELENNNTDADKTGEATAEQNNRPTEKGEDRQPT